jgi:BirA family biotin operon repressor/biotin-[acetyl-CoA-carboxylase] ligase
MQDVTDLSPERVEGLLTTRRLGRPCLFFVRVGSTNDVARRLGDEGAADGLLVVADEQTAGRGRLDRRWWAPPGSSLLMSLLLRPRLPLSRAMQLTMCLGLGAVEGIEAATGLRPALKWPNDLLLGGRKLGGILSELQADGDGVAYAVLGLGLNVNLDLRGAPPADVAAAAAGLSDALGRAVDRAALLASILLRCEFWLDALLGPAPAAPSLHEAWAARLDTLGRDVAVTTAAGVLHGLAAGVTPDGALLVRTRDGETQAIWSGDVSSLRS